MSRSYRKPLATEGYGKPDKKRRKRSAARAVRAADVPPGGAYKKVFNPWDICDWKIEKAKDDKKRNRK